MLVAHPFDRHQEGLVSTQAGGFQCLHVAQQVVGELVHVSAVLHDMANAGLEMVDTENLRPHYARTLWAWSDALEAQLAQAQAILSAQTDAERSGRALRAYRLYLAGCAMGFEQGWMGLHQMLSTNPSGDWDAQGLRGAQSDYPFQREYMYSKG